MLITLTEVKGGDSNGMRETDETSQRTRELRWWFIAPPVESVHLKRKSVVWLY